MTPAPSRSRPVGVWILIVAGLVLALVAAAAIWVERLALDEENFVETTSEVLESEEVQVVLSTFLVDQLYANVDVAAELRARLPAETKGLAAPLAGGLRQVAVRAADRALDSAAVHALHDKGVLTEEEFASEKTAILGDRSR